jgi:carboxypeptidase PM20D1
VARAAAWQTPVHLLPVLDRFFKAASTLESGERRALLANAKGVLATPRVHALILSDPYRNAILRNTIAPTALTRSSRANIVPPVAFAELDIRLMPDADTTIIRRDLSRVIGDRSVHIEVMRGVTSSYSADIDTVFVRAVDAQTHEMLRGARVTTALAAGATDLPTCGHLGIHACGLESYIYENSECERGVHGIDERSRSRTSSSVCGS